jgi:nitronate monooxygenase
MGVVGRPALPRATTTCERRLWTCRVRRRYVVSFHFGLPDTALLVRVKAAGCAVISSATTVDEALWLEAHGVDAIVAQGCEAGGHRGMFLDPNINNAIASQPGTLALVPQVVDGCGWKQPD